jgi:hypothetical protein
MGGNDVPGAAVHPVSAFLLHPSSTLVLLRLVVPFLLLLPAFRLLLLCSLLFFFCWVLETRLGDVEPLLPIKSEPYPDLDDEAR